jgi:hypothetical protein
MGGLGRLRKNALKHGTVTGNGLTGITQVRRSYMDSMPAAMKEQTEQHIKAMGPDCRVYRKSDGGLAFIPATGREPTLDEFLEATKTQIEGNHDGHR